MNPVMSTHNSTRSHYNYWPGIPPVVPLEAELTLRPYSVITTTATRLPHAIDGLRVKKCVRNRGFSRIDL